MTEEDKGRRQPRPLLIGHYVAITVVLPQLIGCRCHVKVDVAVIEKTTFIDIKVLSIRGPPL